MKQIANTQYTLQDETQIEIYEKIEKLSPVTDFNYSWDDIGLANLFEALFSGTFCFCHEVKSWYYYEDGIWTIDAAGLKVTASLRDAIQLLKLYCMSGQPSKDVDEQGHELWEKYKKFLQKCSVQPVIVRVLNLSKDLLAVSKTQFDSNPYLLHCTNGVYDMKTFKFRPAKTEDYFTLSTSVPYIKNYNECPRWETFVDEITSHDKDKAWYLQKALGYSLLGDPKHECIFIAYGKTRCGKSTLFNTIAKVLGMGTESGYGGTVSSSLITVSKYSRERDYNAPEPMLASTVGLRYVTMSETEQNVMLNETDIKTLTGRDPIKTRQLHCPAFTFTPQFTIWLSTNFLPKVNDTSVFDSDRIWVIPFNEHFESDTRQENLKEIFSSYEGRVTALQWLIKGYEGYANEGLKAPEAVVEATLHYAQINDRMGNFVRDCIEERDGGFVNNKSLYTAYKAWCMDDERLYKPVGTTTFYSYMERYFKRGRKVVEGKQVRGFADIELSTDGGLVRIEV